jgi:mRNA interferase MazF
MGGGGRGDVARRSPKRITAPRRGDVYLVRLDPTVGHEIQKTRPCLVVQEDTLNRWSGTTIVALITSHDGSRVYPSEVLVRVREGGLVRESLVLTQQIRTVDRARLERRLGSVRPETLRAVDRALLITLALIEV